MTQKVPKQTANGINADAAIIGPQLFLDFADDVSAFISAVFVSLDGSEPPPLKTPENDYHPELIAQYPQGSVFRSRFVLPLTQACNYEWNGETYEIAAISSNDRRIAYVSCNGEEHDDLDRTPSERNAMWERLAKDHKQRAFSLFLHGGDQIYADEATHGHPLSQEWPDHLPRDPSQSDLVSLRDHLRHAFFDRYVAQLRCPHYAYLAARVPSLCQWDDHDICDGWGSLRRSRTYSPVGQTLFSVAREAFLIFQHGCTAGDLPRKFDNADGLHFGWTITLPELRVIAPDLRGERTRREIMGSLGWAMMEREAQKAFEGRTFLMSSVPLLGPRLSLFEFAMMAIPRMQKYEDDLRDQWQSRAHREEWLRMLRLIIEMAQSHPQDVTVLSGEIHLATRAEMPLTDGRNLHQLVASGISHRPPPSAWARLLGTIASFGEAPLPRHPIRIARIPGRKARYVNERNYLSVSQRGHDWTAHWEFEHSGPSDRLDI